MDDLARKTIVGFAQLILALGLLLFGSAWTLDFWQAWLYLFVFAASTGLITAYLWKKDRKLLERRVRAGPGAETQRNQQAIQVFASAAFIGLFVVASLDRRFSWSHLSVAEVIAGDVLVIVGFAIVFIAFRENSFTAATIEVAADQSVIASGPYALVRHPMYAGALVLLFGTPLALGSWWALVPLGPMTLVLVLRLLDEERFLAKNLAGYSQYCGTVKRRLLPFLW